MKVAGLLSVAACLAVLVAGPTRTTAPRPTVAHVVVAPAAGILSSQDVSQARRMQGVTAVLRHELRAAAACDLGSASYEPCVLPALRHMVIAGRTAAFVLRAVIDSTTDAECRGYLLELQAADAAASDEAQWTMQQLYDRSVQDRRHRAARQLRGAAAMLTRATAPRHNDACSPVRDVLPA